MILLSADKRLTFISNSQKLAVYDNDKNIYLQETKFSQYTQPKYNDLFRNGSIRITELKNGDVYFTVNEIRYKYSRNNNTFKLIRRGIHIAQFFDTDKSSITKTIVIYKDCQIVKKIETHTYKNFVRYGKRNLYFIRKEKNLHLFCRMVFDVKKDKYKTIRSDARVTDAFDTSILVDEDNSRVFFKADHNLYVLNMYTMKLQRLISKVVAFNKKNIIVHDELMYDLRAKKLLLHSADDFKLIHKIKSKCKIHILLQGDYIIEAAASTIKKRMTYSLINVRSKVHVCINLIKSPFEFITMFVVRNDNTLVYKHAFGELDYVRLPKYNANQKNAFLLGENCDIPVGRFMNSELFDRNLLNLVFSHLFSNKKKLTVYSEKNS